jgi:hypothetical protein
MALLTRLSSLGDAGSCLRIIQFLFTVNDGQFTFHDENKMNYVRMALSIRPCEVQRSLNADFKAGYCGFTADFQTGADGGLLCSLSDDARH